MKKQIEDILKDMSRDVTILNIVLGTSIHRMPTKICQQKFMAHLISCFLHTSTYWNIADPIEIIALPYMHEEEAVEKMKFHIPWYYFALF